MAVLMYLSMIRKTLGFLCCKCDLTSFCLFLKNDLESENIVDKSIIQEVGTEFLHSHLNNLCVGESF